MPELRRNGARAGLSRRTYWFNSEPLSIRQLRGRLVLLDFWTYC